MAAELELTDDDWAWRANAECRRLKLPTDWFYPERGQLVRPEVKAACNACPVRGECQQWALEHEHHGYWGGLARDPDGVCAAWPGSG